MVDLGQITTAAVDAVRDLLQAVVGKMHKVGPYSVVKVTCFLVAEVVTGASVPYGPPEVVVGPGGGGDGSKDQEGEQLCGKRNAAVTQSRFTSH